MVKLEPIMVFVVGFEFSQIGIKVQFVDSMAFRPAQHYIALFSS